MELEESGPMVRRYRVNTWWMMLAIVSTSTTAYFLSIFGWIPVNPIYAAIVGLLFGTLFVLYQLLYFKEISRRIHPTEQEPDGELH